MITTELTRLHYLAWHPGRWMTDQWWETLNLKQWQETYRDYPSCRLALDQLIVERRGFPSDALPAMINENESRLLALEPRLGKLLTAMGLIALRCKDYLLLGHYRRALSVMLGEKGCDPLLLIGTEWHGKPIISSDNIVSEAQQEGIAWLSQEKDNIIWHALSILLPLCNRSSKMTASALPMLFKVAKFL